MAARKHLAIVGLLLAAVACRVALSQQAPITLTIEYQSTDELSADQQALLKAAVNAAYRSLQTYVLSKTTTTYMLAQRVCRNYTSAPSPPSPPPSPPPAPDLPSAPAGRRLLAHPGASDLGGRLAAATATTERSMEQARTDAAELAAATALSHGGRRLQQSGITTRCYPDFDAAATDDRLATCGYATISRRHVQDPAAAAGTSYGGGGGEATNLYLYVTADSSDETCTGAGTATVTCLYDLDTGRPTMSAINVCPQALDANDPSTLVARLLREMFFALGVGRVGFYGLAATSLTSAYIVEQDDNGYALQFLATSTVKQVVQDHFGCTTAPGAQLEDALIGGPTAADTDASIIMSRTEVLLDDDYNTRSAMVFSGWETTHFQGDILVADSSTLSAAAWAPQVTRLTLALVADTTWYAVNASAQGYWLWGKGAGCDVASRHCTATLNAAVAAGSTQLFCNRTTFGSRALCAPGSATVGACETAGAYSFPCGLVSSLTPRLPTCALREAEVFALSAGSASASAAFGWRAGYSSRCAAVTWPWVSRPNVSVAPTQFPETLPNPPLGASCFAMSCSSVGELYVNVLGTLVRCPSGATVNLTAQLPASAGLTSAVLGPCPVNGDVCSGLSCLPASCSPTGGECRPDSTASGGARCYCRPGYSGAACTTDLLTGATEDLAALTSAYALLETAVTLSMPLSSFYGRQAQFVRAVADSSLAGIGSSVTQSLAVARVQSMGSYPSYTGAATDVRVVVRFTAANKVQADVLEPGFAEGLDVAALTTNGFTAVAGSSVYLGQTILRTLPPPQPPSPPLPPRPPPLPPASPPVLPPDSGDDDGLTGDEKVALGVGITFGVLLLLLLLLLWRSFRHWQQASYEEAKKDRKAEIRRLEKEILAAENAEAAARRTDTVGREDSHTPLRHEDVGVLSVEAGAAAAAAAGAQQPQSRRHQPQEEQASSMRRVPSRAVAGTPVHPEPPRSPATVGVDVDAAAEIEGGPPAGGSGASGAAGGGGGKNEIQMEEFYHSG